MGPKTFASNWSKWTLSFIAIRNLRKQPSLVIKTAWYLIIATTTIAFFVHAGILIHEYAQFSSRANLKIFYLPKMPFPAVTVCSINPFKQTKLGSSAELTQFMEAYNFIREERQKLLKSNGTSSSSNSALSDYTLLSRKKRQTCETVYNQNQYNTSFFYREYDCNNQTALYFYCVDNSTATYMNLSYPLNTQKTKIMDAVFYYCIAPILCTPGQNICTMYTDSMAVLHGINDCLKSNGLISSLNYPTDFWTGNPANDMARRIGINCGFVNPYYTYAYFEKPSNTYPGTYYYSSGTYNGYGHINMTIENCDLTDSYSITAEIPSNCSNAYITIINTLVECMSNYSCGKDCIYAACPYTETPIDQCGNSAYYNTLCAIAVCNQTSTTEYSTSTTPQLTTELSTSTELTTSIELTSTTSITPITSIEPSTTQEPSTSTSSSSSSTSTNTPTTTTFSSTSTSTPLITSTSTLFTTSPLLTTLPSSTLSISSSSISTSTPITTLITTTPLITTSSTPLSTIGTSSTTIKSTQISTTPTPTTLKTSLMTTKVVSTTEIIEEQSTSLPFESTMKSSTELALSSTSEPLITSSQIDKTRLTSTQESVVAISSKSPKNTPSIQPSSPTHQSPTSPLQEKSSILTTHIPTSHGISTKSPTPLTSTQKSTQSQTKSTPTSSANQSTISTSKTSQSTKILSSTTPQKFSTPKNVSTSTPKTSTVSNLNRTTSHFLITTKGKTSNLTTKTTTTALSTRVTPCCSTFSTGRSLSIKSGKSTALTLPTRSMTNSNISSVTPMITMQISSKTTRPMTPREIANLWGLSEYQNQPSFIAHVQQALIEIAASLTPAEREELCYSLPELVSSCNMGEQPCDMDNDFAQVFDVNYGFCYTYNPQLPNGIHDSSRTGPNNGLRMVLFTNPITYLNSTESKGFKIVTHAQDYSPFPNTEGYFGDIGRSIDLILEENRYTRLGKPYGDCDTSETLEKRGQPFYFNGSYSIEGCFRSCFQQKVVEKCQCADPRFPYTEPGMFCIQTNATNYACNQNYISKYGDYYFVNCTCYNPCNETDFSAQLWHGKWPSGNFFYEEYCPSAELSELNCEQYYRNNSAEIYVYYSRLTYSTLEEVATSHFVDLLSNVGGSSGLWIGCTVVTIGELLLLLIQSILWLLCCRYELPEVPSCRRNDYSIDESRGSWDGSDPSGLKDDPHPAMPFRNSVCDMNNSLYEDDVIPEFQLIYKKMIPVRGDHVPPMPSTPSPVPPFFAD